MSHPSIGHARTMDSERGRLTLGRPSRRHRTSRRNAVLLLLFSLGACSNTDLAPSDVPPGAPPVPVEAGGTPWVQETPLLSDYMAKKRSERAAADKYGSPQELLARLKYLAENSPPDCPDGLLLQRGECRFPCNNDDDCGVGGICLCETCPYPGLIHTMLSGVCLIPLPEFDVQAGRYRSPAGTAQTHGVLTYVKPVGVEAGATGGGRSR